MKEGMAGQQIPLRFEPSTLFAEHLSQGIQGLEPGVGNGRIGQGLQRFGRLKFR